MLVIKQLPLFKEKTTYIKRNGFVECPKCKGQMMTYKYDGKNYLNCIQCGKEILLTDGD